MQASYTVISTRLFAGKTVIHVLADNRPDGFEPVEGGLEDVYFSTLSVASPRGLRGDRMLLRQSRPSRSATSSAIPSSGFPSRLLPARLRHTSSENVSIGTPGGVHKNAPNAIAIATAVFSLFYYSSLPPSSPMSIVRDDATGFAPIVRSTRSPRSPDVMGRFLGGLFIAWLGYLAIPAGMFGRARSCRGSIRRPSGPQVASITCGRS